MRGASAGQPSAGASSGGSYALAGGFWQSPQSLVSVEPPLLESPSRFHLYPAQPNPFVQVTRVAFDLPRSDRATVEVFSLSGQRVRSLLDGERGAGRHEAWWYGTDESGSRVSNGIYFVRVRAGAMSDVTRVILIN